MNKQEKLVKNKKKLGELIEKMKEYNKFNYHRRIKIDYYNILFKEADTLAIKIKNDYEYKGEISKGIKRRFERVTKKY